MPDVNIKCLNEIKMLDINKTASGFKYFCQVEIQLNIYTQRKKSYQQLEI